MSDAEVTRWGRVKEVLADALELEPDARSAFLDVECAGDSQLRTEVESLLPSESVEHRFLERPAVEWLRAPEPTTGERIGGYELLRVIGEGGMGRVYEARQERPHRTVALKVMRPGFVARGADRRFEWEVEALGRLNHPAIAKVYDAGIEPSAEPEQLPLSWFAMELIDGRPLLEATTALDLDRRARLELFASVCDGVAHAHQRGVIHRDLKPENILVDDQGAPHILDFGIARVADPLASAVTTAGEIVGTLAYMSPEQLAGDPDRVDARADVYALGGILYRLLTGAAPLELDGLSLPQAALRLEREEPTPASHHDRSLRGDLETILATALASDVDRRYSSVERLAADIRRVLADEPITARPPTTIYQLAKFVRRHRGLTAALAASLVLLIVAVVGTSAGMIRASRALARAEIERDRARHANRILEAMFASANPELDGYDVRVVDLLDHAGAELTADDNLDPAVRASLHLTLGKTYGQLGLLAESEAQLARATTLFETCDGELAETTLDAKAYWAEALFEIGAEERAATLSDQISAAVRALDDPPPWLVLRPLELATSRAESAGDREAYVAATRRVYEAWLAAGPGHDEPVDTARNNLAVALLHADHPDEAEALLRESLAYRIERMGPHHPRVLIQRINLATSLNDIGKTHEAAQALAELIELTEATWGPRHDLVLTTRNNFAGALERLGRHQEAFAIYERLLATTTERYGPDHRETLLARNNYAVSAMHMDRYAIAERELRTNLDSLDRRGVIEDPMFRLRLEMNLASALDGLDRDAEALPVSASVVARLKDLVGAGHRQTLIARNNHTTLLLELGRVDEAVALARRNCELAEAHQPGRPENAFPFRSNLGRALSLAGRHTDAIHELSAVEAILAANPAAPASDRARCRELLAAAHDAAGNVDEAAKWRQRSANSERR